MKQPTKYQLKQFGLTPDDWTAIVKSCQDNVAQAEDCGYGHNSTILAELVAMELGRQDWLEEDVSHPLFDAALDACEQANKTLDYYADEPADVDWPDVWAYARGE